MMMMTALLIPLENCNVPTGTSNFCDVNHSVLLRLFPDVNEGWYS